MAEQRILIVFDTSEGQTEKIARRISDALSAEGIEAELQPAVSAPAPDAYDGVVVGGSIHTGKYGESLVSYLAAHVAALNAMPAALFQVSLTSANPDDAHTVTARGLVDNLLASSGFDPDLVGMFAGAVVYTQYGWIKRHVMKAIVAAEGGDTDTTHDHEYTDWQAVEHFATAVRDLVRNRALGER